MPILERLIKEILKGTGALLASARERDTQQGILVYERVMEKLGALKGENEIRKVLDYLSRSLSGIEAHGYFTHAEWKIVQELHEKIRAYLEEFS